MKLGEAMGGLKSSTQPVKAPNVIRLDSDELPDIRNWKPGQRYRIVLEVEQLNMKIGGPEYGGYEPGESKKADPNEVSASFRIIGAKPQYGGGPVKQAASGKPDKSATMSALQRKAAQ